MRRALTVKNIYDTKYKLVQWGELWQQAFGNPEAYGIWLIHGNSGNAKTTFIVMLINELSKQYDILFNSREEGDSYSLQQTLLKAGVDPANRHIKICSDSDEELQHRLTTRRCPPVVVIDSIQYSAWRFADYIALERAHPNKLFILVSQAEGKLPAGKVGKRLLYHAKQKIQVIGYQANSNGRCNPGGKYVIWPDGAIKYHGTGNPNQQNQNQNES